MAFPATFLDLQDSVIAKVRLSSSDDRDKVKDWINSAYYQACVETEFFSDSSATTALAANAHSVAVPTTIFYVDYVVPTGSDGSVWQPLNLVPFDEILENRAWASGTPITGAPTQYAFRAGSSPSIEFYPNASGGEILTFYGSSLPDALVDDADLPAIPEPYGSNLLDYGACEQAAEFKKDPLIDYYSGNYELWVRKFRSYLNTRGGNKTQQLRVDRMRPYPRGNSVDTPFNS